MFRLTPREARLIVALSAALVVGYAVQHWRLRAPSATATAIGETKHDGKN